MRYMTLTMPILWRVCCPRASTCYSQRF